MLAILTSHPIQYQAPLWRALAAEGGISFEVWFLTDHAVKPSHDREFGRQFAWDLNLLEGYPHRFLPVREGWRLDRSDGIEVTEPWSKLFKESGVTRLWVEGWRFRENWAAIFAAHRAGIEVWLRGETNDLRPRSGLREFGRRLLLGQLFRRVSRFLCIGTANRRFYRSFGVSEAKLGSAPYCVDNAWFAGQAAPLREKRREIRQRWKIPDDAYCLLFCGKFIPKKRPMDLVKGVSWNPATDGDQPKVHLLFVGSGELGAEVRANCHVVFDADGPPAEAPAADAGKPSASFAGFLNQQQIIEAYVAADCLVLLSDTGETWGLVVNEAMACDLPALASDQCGCAEDLVAPLFPEAVFPMGDAAGLARAVGKVIAHPPDKALIRRLSDAFSIHRTVETVIGWSR